MSIKLGYIGFPNGSMGIAEGEYDRLAAAIHEGELQKLSLFPVRRDDGAIAIINMTNVTGIFPPRRHE